MLTISDFKVGDAWFNGEEMRFRIIAIDTADLARPVVTRAGDGRVVCYSDIGLFGDKPGPFDLIRKAPKEAVRYISLFRNSDGVELVQSSSLSSPRRARVTGYDLVATARVAFLEAEEVVRG